MKDFVLIASILALAALATVLQLLKPELLKPYGLIVSGLALFWIRHKYFRIEGMSGSPLGKLSSIFRSRPRRKVTKVM
jgi:hypothetical protein